MALVLGDNMGDGHGFGNSLKRCIDPDGGIVFAYQVSNPERYGVVEFDANRRAISVEEKPEKPKSNYAVVAGLYFYDNDVVRIAKGIKPSGRGELEITSINEEYLRRGKLKVQTMGRGSAWLDTGTFESMNNASQFVEVIEKRTGFKIGCIQEVAWQEGYIDSEQLQNSLGPFLLHGYGEYLKSLV